MLLCHSNHSAFNSHNFPRSCTTTYPCSICRYSLTTKPPHHVRPLDSELTSSPPVVLTDWLPSLSTPSALRSLSLPFQLRALHDPLRDYSPPILPLCIQYIQPTCRDCTPHVPRRLWKVRDSNPRIVLTIAALAVRCFQPLSQPSLFCMSLWHSDLNPDRLLLVKSHYSASQLHNLARCNHSLYLVLWVC